jgi:hypothetical protein
MYVCHYREDATSTSQVHQTSVVRICLPNISQHVIWILWLETTKSRNPSMCNTHYTRDVTQHVHLGGFWWWKLIDRPSRKKGEDKIRQSLVLSLDFWTLCILFLSTSGHFATTLTSLSETLHICGQQAKGLNIFSCKDIDWKMQNQYKLQNVIP